MSTKSKKENEPSVASFEQLPEIMTVEETASFLRVNRKTVLELYHAKILPGKRLGKKIIRFHRDVVISFMKDADSANYAQEGK